MDVICPVCGKTFELRSHYMAPACTGRWQFLVHLAWHGAICEPITATWDCICGYRAPLETSNSSMMQHVLETEHNWAALLTLNALEEM